MYKKIALYGDIEAALNANTATFTPSIDKE